MERSVRFFIHHEPSLFQHPSLTLQKVRSIERDRPIPQFSLTWLVYVHQLSLSDHGVRQAGNALSKTQKKHPYRVLFR